MGFVSLPLLPVKWIRRTVRLDWFSKEYKRAKCPSLLGILMKNVFSDYIKNSKTTGSASAFSISPHPNRSLYSQNSHPFENYWEITFILGQ